MLPSNILSSLILAAAAWIGANFYKQAADDAARNHVLMTAETTPLPRGRAPTSTARRHATPREPKR